MARPVGSLASTHPGLVGLYALAMMEKEGPVHGYGVAERIAERTDGSWRPGPGAVYPSLQKLVGRGWARVRVNGRRRIYEVTPEGRRSLARLREHRASMSSRADLTALWAEVHGSDDVDAFLVQRLQRTLGALDLRLTRGRSGEDRDDALSTAVERELTDALARVRKARSLPTRSRRSSA